MRLLAWLFLVAVAVVQADLAAFLRTNKLQKYKVKLGKQAIRTKADVEGLMKKPLVEVNKLLKDVGMTESELSEFKKAARSMSKKEAPAPVLSDDEQMMSVERFLVDNKMGQYIAQFQGLGVEELDDLVHVTEADLVSMGASKIKIRAFIKSRKELGLTETTKAKEYKGKNEQASKFNSRGNRIIPRINKPVSKMTEMDAERMPLSQFVETHAHRLDESAKKHIKLMTKIGVDLDTVNLAMLRNFQENPEALLKYTDTEKMQEFATKMSAKEKEVADRKAKADAKKKKGKPKAKSKGAAQKKREAEADEEWGSPDEKKEL